MAQFTLTVPDAAVPRIRKAFGHRDPITQQWVDATLQDVQAAIKSFMRSRVIDYETGEQAMEHRKQLSQENWD